jgi:hypothetical protein
MCLVMCKDMCYTANSQFKDEVLCGNIAVGKEL